MSLIAYYDLFLRLETIDGEIFEGFGSHCSAEYCLHEFGREEEAMQIDNWLFYVGDIRRVQPIESAPTHIWQNRTEYDMRLDAGPFRAMEEGRKTVELRLYDEKRRQLRPGDAIRFENADDETESLHVLIKAMHLFPDFTALYAALDLRACGYRPEELVNASPIDMERYYSPVEQKRWGVVGIEIELI